MKQGKLYVCGRILGLTLIFAGCTPSSNSSNMFSRVAGNPDINVMVQQFDVSSGMLKVDLVGLPLYSPLPLISPIPDPVTKIPSIFQLEIGQTPFATPITTSYFLQNKGETAAEGFSMKLGNPIDFSLVNQCGTRLVAAAPKKPLPAPCRVDLIFNPKGFGDISTTLTINYFSKGVAKTFSGKIVGHSIREPSLRFLDGAYQVPSPVSAGLKGQFLLFLFFNGDLDPTHSVPALTFSSGFNSGLSYPSQLSIASQNPTDQPAIDAILNAGPVFLEDISDKIFPTSSSALPPGLLPTNKSTWPACGSTINTSCYVLMDFTPSFNTGQVTLTGQFQNQSQSAVNWAGTFSSNISLTYLFSNSSLPLSQRTSTTKMSGLAFNGVQLGPLVKSAIVFGTGPVSTASASSAGAVTGPFDLAPGGSTATVPVFPVPNNGFASGTVGVPVKISIVSQANADAENVVVTGLPLPNAPSNANAYYQDSVDVAKSTCMNTRTISFATGCVVYMHFAPRPNGLTGTDGSTFIERQMSAPKFTITYDYASHQVTGSSPFTTPVVISDSATNTNMITATATKPAKLDQPSPNIISFASSFFCSKPASTSVSVRNTGGIGTALTLTSPITTPISVSGCSVGPNNGTCSPSGSYLPSPGPVPTAAVNDQVIAQFNYLSGSTLSPNPQPISIVYSGAGSPNTLIGTQLSASVTSNNTLTSPANAASVCGLGSSAVSLQFGLCGTNPVSIPTSLVPGLSCNGNASVATSGANKVITPTSAGAVCTFTGAISDPGAGCVESTPAPVFSTGITGEVPVTARMIYAPAPTPNISGSIAYGTSPSPVPVGSSGFVGSGSIIIKNSSPYFSLTVKASPSTTPAGSVVSTDLTALSPASWTIPNSNSSSDITLAPIANSAGTMLFTPTGTGSLSRNMQFTFTNVLTGLDVAAANPNPSVQAFADGTSKVTISAGSNFNGGTVFSTTSLSATVRFKVLGTDTGWNTNWPNAITPSPLPAEMSLNSDPLTSTCLKTPGVVATRATPGTCDLVFSITPATIGAFDKTLTFNYQSNGGAAASPPTARFQFNYSNPSASLSLTTGSTPITSGNPLNLHGVLANIAYTAKYDIDFKNLFGSNTLWNSAVTGYSGGNFVDGNRVSCGPVTIKNTSSGGSGATATLTFPAPVVSSPFVIIYPNGKPSTLTPQQSVIVNVCFAPTAVSAQSASFDINYTSPGNGTSTVTIYAKGNGVQPVKIFAGGNWTLISDGLGQTHAVGSQTVNLALVSSNFTSPTDPLVPIEASIGGNYFCRLVSRVPNNIVQCGTSPLDTTNLNSPTVALSTSTPALPVGQISFPGGAVPQSISVGAKHACALVMDAGLAKVACWGDNLFGQLGTGSASDGSTPPALMPTFVSFPQNEVPEKVTAANDFSCASLQKGPDHWVRCWGASAQGQMGIGAQFLDNKKLSPAQFSVVGNIFGEATCPLGICDRPVSSLSVVGNATSAPVPFLVAAGGIFSSAGTPEASPFNCMLSVADGNIRCFGQNNNNTLGSGLANGFVGNIPNDMSSLVAVPLPDFSTASAPKISIGNKHSCALYPSLSNPSTTVIGCWGDNSDGALGIGVASPGTAVSLPETNEISIVTGANHSCTVAASNKVYCWGDYGSAGAGIPVTMEYDALQ